VEVGLQENVTLYRIGLSAAGALSIGLLGLIVGAFWSWAVDVDASFAIVLAAIAGLWGAIVVQLTPTGGVIMENKTTVNYAVVALHGWYAFFLCLIALVVWALRVWAL
jgi:hypothetical protein